MSSVLYYSNFCDNSKKLLLQIANSPIKKDIHFICIDNRIKQNDKEYTKTFSVKKYGYEEAKQMAIDARKQFNEQFSCANS